jgi:hypothetical protein
MLEDILCAAQPVISSYKMKTAAACVYRDRCKSRDIDRLASCLQSPRC